MVLLGVIIAVTVVAVLALKLVDSVAGVEESD
jgi:hypothetical protein